MTAEVVVLGVDPGIWARGPRTTRARAAPTPPDRPIGVLTERVRTSCSPARADRASSVRTSPMPGSTTVVPNSDRKPSAAAPHRVRAWDRSCRQAKVSTPCPPPSLTMAGRSGMGRDVGHLVEGEGDRHPGTDHSPGVGGGADVGQEAHHEGGGHGLMAARGAHIEGGRGSRRRPGRRSRARRSWPGLFRFDTRPGRQRRWTRCRSAPEGRWRRSRPAGPRPGRPRCDRGLRGPRRRCAGPPTTTRWRDRRRRARRRAGAVPTAIRRARSSDRHRRSRRGHVHPHRGGTRPPGCGPRATRRPTCDSSRRVTTAPP